MNKSILIIDDDNDLAQITADILANYGYQVTIAHDGERAYELLSNHKYHLILLDINLPQESGYEICRELRKVSTVPIIFASARTSEDDRITGFDIGGDDYLPKPYSLKELLSRVNALYRRTYGFGEEERAFRIGNIIIEPTTRSVTRNNEPVSLSLKEFDLLLYLAQNMNRAIPKEQILREVWGSFSEVEQATVAVHIRWLREKLEKDPSHPEHLMTVWGIGYSLNDKSVNE